MKTAEQTTERLLRDAMEAFTGGRLADAELNFLRLVGAKPDHAPSYNLLARICLRQSRIDEAEHYVDLALMHGGGAPQYQDTVADILVETGRAAQAESELRKAVAAKPGDFGSVYGLAALLARLGRNEEALEWFLRAQGIVDDFPALRLRIIRLMAAAQQHREAIDAIEGARAKGDDYEELHGIAGNCHLALGDPKSAAESFQKAIRLKPERRENYVALSAALARGGLIEQARELSLNFIRRWPSWTTPGVRPEATVLVLGGVGRGYFDRAAVGENIYKRGNTISQVGPERFTFRHLLVDHPDPAAVARAIGPVDVVFNNLANAEMVERNGYVEKARAVVDALGVPVINAPEALARTSRWQNAIIVPRETDIVFPRTLRYQLSPDNVADCRNAILESFPFPFIVRSALSHYDTGTFLVAGEAELDTALAENVRVGNRDIYAIEYRTEEFEPGVFRKIRCALIDGEVHLVHVDFSPNWNVHRTRSDQAEIEFMKASLHLMEQEHAFLRDPEGCLGETNMRRLQDLARVMELDFVGLDFNILSNGDLVIFELNAAMSTIIPHKVKHFPYFADYWQRIEVAVENMILRKAGKA